MKKTLIKDPYIDQEPHKDALLLSSRDTGLYRTDCIKSEGFQLVYGAFVGLQV